MTELQTMCVETVITFLLLFLVECSVTSVRVFGDQSNVVCNSCICRNGDIDISLCQFCREEQNCK